MNVKILAAAITLMTAGLFGASAARAGSLVDVEVLARAGYRANLPSYWYRGQNYVEGRQNQEFRVRLRNKGPDRVMAVLSVDGVNAISGETAGVNQTGYVLAPYQTLDVDGWRKSNVRTAAFYFTHINDSYAARTQRPDNVGVIGVAVFRELRYEYDDEEEYDEYSQDDRYPPNDGYAGGKSGGAPASGVPATPAPATRAVPPGKPGAAKSGEAAPAQSKSFGQTDGAGVPGAPLGTGHGRPEYRPSVSVTFEREPQVFEVLKVRYDSRANLIAQGVIPRPGQYRPTAPEAFPQGQFVPDPR